jgi:hypothetical protein
MENNKHQLYYLINDLNINHKWGLLDCQINSFYEKIFPKSLDTRTLDFILENILNSKFNYIDSIYHFINYIDFLKSTERYCNHLDYLCFLHALEQKTTIN